MSKPKTKLAAKIAKAIQKQWGHLAPDTACSAEEERLMEANVLRGVTSTIHKVLEPQQEEHSALVALVAQAEILLSRSALSGKRHTQRIEWLANARKIIKQGEKL